MKNYENEKLNLKIEIKPEQKNKKEEQNIITELNYHKLQIENAKKDNEILKLREEIQQFKKYGFDTSSSFPWPDEFKKRWEIFVRTMIMDNFDTINTNYILLMRTINIIVKIIYEISQIQIRQKIIELLKCLGLQNISDINISNFYNKFQRLLFQDFFKTLFNVSNEFYNSILKKIKNALYNKRNIFNEKEIEDILKDLNNGNIIKFIREIYFLCLYMNINEPKLTIKTSIDINYRYYNKNEYDNIEGFGKDNDICIIILNPPMLGYDKPFKGLKPAVFIIENPSKEIIDMCEEQKRCKSNNNNNIATDRNRNENNIDFLKEKIKNTKIYEEKIIKSQTNNLININNNSSEMNYKIKKNFMTIENETNDNINYIEFEKSLPKKKLSENIKKQEPLKFKNSTDCFIKKHIINPINIQKYTKRSEEKKDKFVQKKLKGKLKNIHLLPPQKLNSKRKKNPSHKKNNSKKINKIEIERNASNEANEINDKIYNNTETNINMSTPLTNSILDLTNNTINLMEKNLGLYFYSTTKSQSPSIINNKNSIENKTKRSVKQKKIDKIICQFTLENNERLNNKNLNLKELYKNCNFINNQKIDQERVFTEVKQRNIDIDCLNKGKILDSMKNNLNQRMLSYKNIDKNINKNMNNYNNKKFNHNYVISKCSNENINNNFKKINNYINTGIIMNSFLNNNEMNYENEFNKKIGERTLNSITKNNLKNLNNIYDINNTLETNNDNNNNYNYKDNSQYLEGKNFLRRKINNSINLTRQKDNIENNNNININSINSTQSNNNININININNNNNNNENNFRGNVILNYENGSHNILKTDSEYPKKIIQKSIKKIDKINSKKKNSQNKNNLNINKKNTNNNFKKKFKIDTDNYFSSTKNNNTINCNNNIGTIIPINNHNHINRLAYNYINTINNENNSIKYTHIKIKKNNIYQDGAKSKNISKKNSKKNNHNYYININSDEGFKINKNQSSYHKSLNNFNNKNQKILKEKYYYNNELKNNTGKKNNRKQSQKTISHDKLNTNTINSESVEKNQKRQLYINLLNHNKKNYNEIHYDSLNDSYNSIKKFNINKKNHIQNSQNNKNYHKDKNKYYSIINEINKSSIVKNKTKKRCKQINQFKTIKNEINSESIKINSINTKRNINKILNKKRHYKIPSSDGIKGINYDDKNNLRLKINNHKNKLVDSFEKLYEQAFELKHKKNILTLPCE